MTPHAWIAAVLDDIVAYAERNDLAGVARELGSAARRVDRMLDEPDGRPLSEGLCDVIRLPARRG